LAHAFRAQYFSVPNSGKNGPPQTPQGFQPVGITPDAENLSVVLAWHSSLWNTRFSRRLVVLNLRPHPWQVRAISSLLCLALVSATLSRQEREQYCWPALTNGALRITPEHREQVPIGQASIGGRFVWMPFSAM
jgi:hypothetical protein